MTSVILVSPPGPRGSSVQVMTDNFLLCCFYCRLIDVTVVAERTEKDSAKQRQRRLILGSGQPRSLNPSNHRSVGCDGRVPARWLQFIYSSWGLGCALGTAGGAVSIAWVLLITGLHNLLTCSKHVSACSRALSNDCILREKTE